MGTCILTDIIVTLPHVPNKHWMPVPRTIKFGVYMSVPRDRREPPPTSSFVLRHMPYATDFDLDAFLNFQSLKEIDPHPWAQVAWG